jgi:hypothetical protein
LAFLSCETEYIPDTDPDTQPYVVEGHIEYGEDALPTYVLLSKSLVFFDTIDATAYASAFVRNAEVSVTHDDETVFLTELCLADLPEDIANAIKAELSILNNIGDFCIYVDINEEIVKEIGGVYELSIKNGQDLLTASTTIPPHVAVDTIYAGIPPGNPPDSMLEMVIELIDAENQLDYYRYLTAVNERPLYSDNASVFDDVFFDGKKVSFAVPRPLYPDEDFDFLTTGLFVKGDTAYLKWSNLDRAHYDFWSSLEFDTNNGGPFASYTRASSNINGGLGIWGGYSISRYSLKIEL